MDFVYNSVGGVATTCVLLLRYHFLQIMNLFCCFIINISLASLSAIVCCVAGTSEERATVK